MVSRITIKRPLFSLIPLINVETFLIPSRRRFGNLEDSPGMVDIMNRVNLVSYLPRYMKATPPRMKHLYARMRG